ncbi:hypothetical protein [Candidatus Palauibacter sp.]|uniref:hypothetical protein n=1 Tax=Candidatus Palauibacter sp. TaxID=3101350 RepID=UPI003CC64AA9
MRPPVVSVLLVAAGVAGLALGNCMNDSVLEAEANQLRWELGRLGDSLTVLAPMVAVLEDSTRTLDSLWRRAEARRATEVASARADAAAAETRFQALAATLPDTVRVPIVAAHDEQVAALGAELAVERGRSNDLARRLSVSTETVRLLSHQVGLGAIRDSTYAALVANLDRRLKGNVSLFGWRFHVRCGLGGAAGIDLSGRANAVVGASCAVSW